jgi:hypothetical protein
MVLTSQEKLLITICSILIIGLCSIVIIIAGKGEKRMVRDEFIKGFFFWPDVHGEKVPIVARRYKLIAMGFASIFIIVSVLFLAIVYSY